MRILIAVIILTLISFNCIAQDTVVTVQYMIAPLYSPYQHKDTGYIAIKFNTVDFKIVSGGLSLANNNVSTSEWYGRMLARKNQKNFVFNNVPTNYWDFQIFKNGIKLAPELDYYKTGNFIYIPSATTNDIIEYYRLR